MGEKIANEATDKALISKIYKQLMHFSIRGKKIEFKNEEEELNKHFSKEDIDG